METLIRNDFVIKFKVKEYSEEKEGCNILGSNRFLGGVENRPLSKPMVYHDQKGIKAGRRRKISDEIAKDLLKRARS